MQKRMIEMLQELLEMLSLEYANFSKEDKEFAKKMSQEQNYNVFVFV